MCPRRQRQSGTALRASLGCASPRRLCHIGPAKTTFRPRLPARRAGATCRRPLLMNRVVLLRLAQGCLAGAALGTLLVGSLPPDAYSKDLQQEYLAASAWRDGRSVFTPVTELSARYFPVVTDSFPHASPHPPILAPLSLPLTWLPFPVTVFLWLLVNVALLVRVGGWLGLSVQIGRAHV